MRTLRNVLLERVTPGDGYFECGHDAEDFADLMRREAEHRDYSEEDVSVDSIRAVLMEPDGAQPDAAADPTHARDMLLSRLIDRLDYMLADPAEHAEAMQETRQWLDAFLGAAQPGMVDLANADGATTEGVTHWYALPGGWFGRRASTQRDAFFSTEHWEPLDSRH